jgi:hypothetical protein
MGHLGFYASWDYTTESCSPGHFLTSAHAYLPDCPKLASQHMMQLRSEPCERLTGVERWGYKQGDQRIQQNRAGTLLEWLPNQFSQSGNQYSVSFHGLGRALSS